MILKIKNQIIFIYETNNNGQTLQYLADSGHQNKAMKIVQENKNAKGIKYVGSYLILEDNFNLEELLNDNKQ